jgi:hypothetical protein
LWIIITLFVEPLCDLVGKKNSPQSNEGGAVEGDLLMTPGILHITNMDCGQVDLRKNAEEEFTWFNDV